MKSRKLRPAPSHSSASAPRFASFSASSGNARRAEALREQLGDVDAGPAQVRRHEQPAGAVDQARAARSPRPPSRGPPRPARRARRRPSRRAASSTASTPRPRLSTATCARWRSSPVRSAARTARKSTPTSSPSPTTRRPLSSTGSAGRPTVPRSSTSVSRTSPNSSSSPTRLDTVVLLSPVSCAIAARERGPWSATWRRTTPRLWRRTERWLAGDRRGSCVFTSPDTSRRAIGVRIASAAVRRASARAPARPRRPRRRPSRAPPSRARQPVGAARARRPRPARSTSSATASRVGGRPSGSPSSSSTARNQPVCARSRSRAPRRPSAMGSPCRSSS